MTLFEWVVIAFFGSLHTLPLPCQRLFGTITGRQYFFTINLNISCPPLLDHVPGRGGYDVKLSRHDASLSEISYLPFILNWEMLGRWCVVKGCSNSSTNQAGISLHYSPVNKSAAVKCGLTWNLIWVMVDQNIVISELESDIFVVCHSFICRSNDH